VWCVETGDVGVRGNQRRHGVDLDYLVGNEIQVFTSLAASNTFPRVLRLMQSKQIQTLPLQAHYPFERIAEAVEDVANKKMRGVKTLVANEAVGD